MTMSQILWILTFLEDVLITVRKYITKLVRILGALSNASGLLYGLVVRTRGYSIPKTAVQTEQALQNVQPFIAGRHKSASCYFFYVQDKRWVGWRSKIAACRLEGMVLPSPFLTTSRCVGM
jgi:hypothetical protein